MPAGGPELTFQIEDYRSTIDPWQFTGSFYYSSAGINILGFDYFSNTALSFNGLNATNINARNGLDIGATFNLKGMGTVLEVTMKSCCIDDFY